ncbi:hypothetical protein KFK09_001812 [Dendrobium nobile]|uniref:Uncharacterized protein n=1 Tax=Dendrobium nobile TaxID=94219 RepID=A0A8T3CBY9_DENNO|nr:hypothetical protein KFK09_001812 [Dendrobium nobile]
MYCTVEVFNSHCCASFVNATSSSYIRKLLWDQVINFHSICNLPWIIGGYFNAITNTSERIGGSSPSYQSMEDFSNMILYYNLINIVFSGNNFTWNKGHLWQHLDRVLFNDTCLNSFSSINV